MGPRFERIPSIKEDDSLVKLERVLLKALPNSVHLLVLCRLACQERFPPEVDVQFYRYIDSDENDENEKDTWWDVIVDPFVVCLQRPNFHTKKGIIMLTPPNPTPEMVQTFDQFIGWESSQVFQCVQPPFWSHLQNMCTKHNNLKPENNLGIPGAMFAILDVEKGKNLDVHLNDDLHTRSIEEKDVPEIAEQWKWKVDHSAEVMRTCIKTLVSCGLFISKDAGNGEKHQEELVSSVVQSPLGVANILYTPEQHRRKGYAKIVMEWIAKESAIKFGIPPMAEIEILNEASRQLLGKVGYVEMFKTRWFYYDPPPPPTVLPKKL